MAGGLDKLVTRGASELAGVVRRAERTGEGAGRRAIDREALAVSPASVRTTGGEAKTLLAEKLDLARLEKARPRLVATPSAAKTKIATVRARPTKRLSEMTLVERNHALGMSREDTVLARLQARHPADQIFREQYLRDADGQILKDPVTGETRRIDFIVMNLRRILDSIEVTSPTASKTAQMAKEMRIRQAGGFFIRHPQTGKLLKLPASLNTRVIRVQ